MFCGSRNIAPYYLFVYFHYDTFCVRYLFSLFFFVNSSRLFILLGFDYVIAFTIVFYIRLNGRIIGNVVFD